MALKFANNARSTLASSVTSTATTMILAPGTGNRFPSLGSGNYFVATVYLLSGEHEVIRVTARAADTITVVRGQENTIPLAFDAGSFIANLPTAGQMASFFNLDNDGAGSGLDADLLRGEAPANTNTPNTIVRRDASGNFAAGTITANIIGNASGTAGSLQTARNINGVPFNGTADITITANTPNTLTAGNGFAAGSFNGASAVSFTLGTPSTVSLSTINSVSANSHTHAFSISAAQINALTAAASEGEVGTYAFLAVADRAAVAPGQIVPGSNLRYAGVNANGFSNNGSVLSVSAVAPVGSWRAMGVTSDGQSNTATLFMRVS